MQTSSYTYVRTYQYISKSVFWMCIYIYIHIQSHTLHRFLSIPNTRMSSLSVSFSTQSHASTRPDDLCGNGISVASSSHDMGTTETEKHLTVCIRMTSSIKFSNWQEIECSAASSMLVKERIHGISHSKTLLQSTKHQFQGSTRVCRRRHWQANHRST